MKNNKKYLTLIVFTIFLSSCSQHFVSLLKTQSSNTFLRDSSLIFENDSVKITYDFWYNRGLLSYSVYNKLNIPLYIDWKKSSYISNENKLNYWVDKEETNTALYFQGLGYNGPLLAPGYKATATVGVSSSTKYKEERITFIPPKSYIYKSSFYLIDNSINLPEPANESIEKKSYNPNSTKTEVVKSQDYNKNNSPFIFRNFLSLSTSENFNTEFYVDTDFWVCKIQKMSNQQFTGLQYNISKEVYTNIYNSTWNNNNYLHNTKRSSNSFFIFK